MSRRSKEHVARRLAESHCAIEPEMQRIFRLVRDDREDDADEPVKLLEVTPGTAELGIVPVHFSADPGRGIDFATIIVDVTPEEFARIESGDLKLPSGWRIGPELTPPRAAPAHAHGDE